ncbi:MAG: hypothetical protein IJH63_10550 [Methanobrevibacter sp.]|nr:hypothetical protein [Methanosphaera sp.]MBR0371140.1 hypothetical protein [Methanobrevibacter sp.]
MTVYQLANYYQEEIEKLKKEKEELLDNSRRTRKKLDKKTRLRLQELDKQIEEYTNEYHSLLG